MQALLADLDGELPPLRMFRPNRDVRFSKDKSPYKLWAGATSESRAVGGTGYYLRIQASGLVTGCGAIVIDPISCNVSVRRSTTTAAAADSRN